MGFQGQLSSVNLTDIFQTLNMNRQTGTLSVSGPTHVEHIYFDQGNITMCSAPVVNGRPYLLDVLAHKGQLSADKLDELLRAQQQSGHPLREHILGSGMVADYELDEICAAAIEELVCPVFEWQQGDFTFIDGGPVQELLGPEAIVMAGAVVQTTQLVMEATRRMDEWKRIREIITDESAFYLVDNEGRANLKNVQTDPDMLKVLRYLDGRHALDQIALAVGVTRFDTFAIVAQLALAGVARPRSPQEVVEDAVALMGQGDFQQARSLLEASMKNAHMPEVMRPLAECCVQLRETPRAVELFLELIQLDQDQGDMATALKDLDTVIALSPDDPDLHFERGQVQAELGQVEDAAASYATAAQAFLARKDLQRAIDACHRAKNLLPRAPDPHRYLARAYLLEGQTENAVVEYKSLWHALLTSERPKAALETLSHILESDCKYANVKDQVLSHAQNSEAIKTSKAARMLVYVLILLLIASGGIAGYNWYQANIVKKQGLDKVVAIEKDAQSRMDVIDHQALLKEIEDLLATYSSSTEVSNRLQTLKSRVQSDFSTRATAALTHAQALEDAGRYKECESAIIELKRRFFGTTAASMADTLQEKLQAEQVKAQVLERRREAESDWSSLQWEKALAALEDILKRSDLPTQLRDELAAQRADWNLKVHSAESLYERAQHIEEGGNKRDALIAYRLASQGQGQAYVDRARARALALELDLAHELGRSARLASQQGDDTATFDAMDRLAALVKESSSPEVADFVENLELDFTVLCDDPHIVLVARRATGEESRITASPGTHGSWRQVVPFRAGESLQVQAQRVGFAPESFTIGIGTRHTHQTISLKRGPRWRIELSGTPTTRPISAGQLLLVGTDKASIEMVDPVTAADRPWHLDSNLANLTDFTIPPVVFQDHAYVVLAEHLLSIDLGSRTTAWRYPVSENDGVRFSGSLLIQEHEIQAGKLLIVAPVLKEGVELLEVDGQGTVTAYPRLAPKIDVTGEPFIDHYPPPPSQPTRSTLYLPCQTGLQVYDVTSVTSDSPPRFLYEVPSKGDLLGRPVRTRFQGQWVVLVADRTGSILAVADDPNLGGQVLKSWVLDGTDPTAPVLDNRGVGYVLVSNGHLIAIDFASTGMPLWQFPAVGQPGLGPVPGLPAFGRLGIYCADQHGVLHCVDARTGSERWQAPVSTAPGQAAVGGVLAQDGRVIVPMRAGVGQLVCFDEGDD